jgi:hypothetical protein
MSRGVAFDNQKPAAYVGLDAVSFIMSDLRRALLMDPARPTLLYGSGLWMAGGRR